VNGQYPDEGTSYRSAIFPQNDVQRRMAASYIASLGRSGAFAKPIATRLESGTFYPAEAEHQDFMRRNPDHPYSQVGQAAPPSWLGPGPSYTFDSLFLTAVSGVHSTRCRARSTISVSWSGKHYLPDQSETSS
jgi:hypothetical protein